MVSRNTSASPEPSDGVPKFGGRRGGGTRLTRTTLPDCVTSGSPLASLNSLYDSVPVVTCFVVSLASESLPDVLARPMGETPRQRIARSLLRSAAEASGSTLKRISSELPSVVVSWRVSLVTV